MSDNTVVDGVPSADLRDTLGVVRDCRVWCPANNGTDVRCDAAQVTLPVISRLVDIDWVCRDRRGLVEVAAVAVVWIDKLVAETAALEGDETP